MTDHRWASYRTLIVIWAAWALLIIGFQTLVASRFQPDRPDDVLPWTANETTRRAQNDKPYLMDPFMNRQISWDSEFYLSIATVGYDDPSVRSVTTPEGAYALNYAFFPLYPLLTRVVRVPLLPLGLTPIATSTLAAVVVSLLGTLGGMVALYDIARARMDERAARRAACALLIFPSSFFLAQVYTEGLFVGLAFGALALMQRRQYLLAGLLAALATWTRSVGVFLVVPMAYTLWLDMQQGAPRDVRRWLVYGVAALLPVAAYLVWLAALGTPFNLVQTAWFGRGFLNFDAFIPGMDAAWTAFVSGENPATRVYFGIEFGAVLLALAATLVTLRRFPQVALFSLIALFIAVTSGAPQSWVRYVLVVPSLHLALAAWGEQEAFERTWVTASVLLMGMLLTLFTFDLWVA